MKPARNFKLMLTTLTILSLLVGVSQILLSSAWAEDSNETPPNQPPPMMPMPVLSAVCKNTDHMYILSDNRIFQLTNEFKILKVVTAKVRNNISEASLKNKIAGKENIDSRDVRIFPTGICLDANYLYVLIFGKVVKYTIPDLKFIEKHDLSNIIGSSPPLPGLKE